MDIKPKHEDLCGCEARAETIGAENWWTIVTAGSAILILALTRGGVVTAQTKQILKIAAAGAVVAVFANKVVKAP